MRTIRRSELDGAVREGILSPAQADRLVAFLAGSAAAVAPGGAQPRFSFVHVLYYLGGMIAIGAMSLFMTLGWNALGDWGWLMMEFGTLAVGVVLLWRYRFPFMLMPIAVTLWYMSMDLVPFLLGQEYVYDWEIRKFISAYFGLAVTLVAFWVDLRSRFSRDYAFWLYLFGVLTFWGGLSLMNSGSELGKLAYCGINVLGVLWQRREAQWSARLRGFLPAPLRELIEARAVR